MTALRDHDRRTVLLVDDQDDIRLLWRLVLQTASGSYEFSEACDGQQAVAAFVADEPDIVITDLAMPVTSGYDVIAAVRDRSPDTVVVVCSAMDARDEAMRHGATAFVPKENSTTHLAATVDACVGAG